MQDPLLYYFNKISFNPGNIESLSCGQKYVAVELKNGNIGVCATLDTPVSLSIPDLYNLDLKSLACRIVFNAYINATLNYNRKYIQSEDIFDNLDFSSYKYIVMVGYFRSLVEKFSNAGIKLTIFDKVRKDTILTDMNKQFDHISNADAIILTSTTIFNETFTEIIQKAGNNSKIFMLGPSTILDEDMFLNRNIEVLFGAVFEKSDKRIHQIVLEGGGTKSFLPYMRKVYITKD